MTMSGQSFDYFRTLVQSRSAIVLEPGKEYLVESRLVPLARTHGYPTLDDLANAMRTSQPGPLHTEAIEAMTTNETSFFRDNHPFEALRTVVIPEILARKAHERRLNIWCAAASTGQESYSVAMLLREHFPALANWTIKFVATDLSTGVLAKARTGRYTQLEANRGLPASLLVKYFTKRENDWQLRDDVRSMVEFRELNLIEPWPPMASVDIVFIRNVLIYFDLATKRDILRRIRSVMSRDGYLFLGSAETTMGIDPAFDRVQLDRCVTYRIARADAQGAPNRAA